MDRWDAPWAMPLPPFATPPGPATSQGEVLAAFAAGEPAGHSECFHVEGNQLLVDRDVSAALRLGPEAVLVRADLPDDLVWAEHPVTEALRAAGMELLDRATLLAAPVAMQVLGLRLSSWDLWGTDIEAAFARLRSAAVGEQAIPRGPADPEGLGGLPW